MRTTKKYQGRKSPQEKETTVSLDSQLPIVASARTGLAGKDEAILRRIPVEYSGKTVRDALDYIVGADLSDKELSLAESVKKELNARGSVVVVNGKTAKLNDNVEKYVVEREHKLPDGTKKKYRELEIEISAVQQGGLYNLVRYN
jgi:hypothetical protein